MPAGARIHSQHWDQQFQLPDALEVLFPALALPSTINQLQIGDDGHAHVAGPQTLEARQDAGRFLLGDVNTDVGVEEVAHQSPKRLSSLGWRRPPLKKSRERPVRSSKTAERSACRSRSTISFPRFRISTCCERKRNLLGILTAWLFPLRKTFVMAMQKVYTNCTDGARGGLETEGRGSALPALWILLSTFNLQLSTALLSTSRRPCRLPEASGAYLPFPGSR